jgi:hypothetical protein
LRDYSDMLKNVAVFLGFALFLTGCVSQEEPMPVVVHDYGATSPVPAIPAPQQPIVQPKAPAVTPSYAPRSWFPPAHLEKSWSAIIVHHSATRNGNAAIFDKWHREENGWEGVGYDFVIGNGTDSGDGEIEATFRWRNQIPGAHTGGTPGNWANVDGIGICLVGDFDRSSPTSRQMQSLVRLVQFLQKRYGIPNSRVYGHGTTPGGHITDCPGRRFPMNWLKSNL